MSEKDLTRLIEILERALGREWVDAAEWIRSLPESSITAIEAKIIANDFAGLFREIEAAATSAAQKFAAATDAAFQRAARAESKWLDKQPSMKERLIRFDADNPTAVQAARENQYKNVQGLVEETRENLRTVLVDGQRAGTNPRVMAREIRSSIGLTDQQAKWVRSYEADLRAGRFGAARNRELHDDRLLRNVKRGDTLTDADIEKMVEAYRKAQLKYRAEMIARTEAARNVHAGSEESFRQAIERGDLDAKDVVREWHPGPRTKHARRDHREAMLLEQRPAWKETFLMPNGARMAYPGDEAGGASNTIHCRCTVSTTLEFSADDADTADASDGNNDAPTPKVPKNPKRTAAAQRAGEASAERRREIHSAARANLPVELQSTWDKEGHKFMREESARIKGVKDRVNASSTLSQAFAEKYGSGAETMFGNEGDRFHVRAEIEAKHAEQWADEQERRYYAAAAKEYDRGASVSWDDDDPPF